MLASRNEREAGLHKGRHGNMEEGRSAETRRRKRIMTMTSDAQRAIVNEIDAGRDQDRYMLPIHRALSLVRTAVVVAMLPAIER